MEQLPTYYMTLKPVREGNAPASGMHHVAYVSDPAIEEIGIYLNRQDGRQVASKKQQAEILEHLSKCGIEKPANWVEVSEEDYLSAREIHMTTDPTERESFNDFSKKDGSGQWLVRYSYEGVKDEKNRDFCSSILSLNRLYTEEEISNGLSNSEFGNYSIFDYKGSYGCRHRWKRTIYFEDYEDGEVRKVGFVPQVVARLDDDMATTYNAFLSADEKMQVVAPLLIPEKSIFRNDELGKWNMKFSKETIVELQEISVLSKVFEGNNFFKDTHEGGFAPSHVVEQWITESEDDKAYKIYGFNLSSCPLGTWFILSQITDKKYWENEIKKQKKYAYSIEAFMNLSIVKLSAKDKLINQIEMEKDQIKLPDGEHLINGTIYIVVDGVVVEKKEVPKEQEKAVEEVAKKSAEELAEVEEKPTEELAVEEVPTVKEEEAPPTTADDDRIAKLEADQETILEEIAKMKESAKPVAEEKEVTMSDNRPFWKRVSDGINVGKLKSI